MDSVAGRRVTLVGGAGFIGHHLALALSERGAEVSVVDGLAVNNLIYHSALERDEKTRSLYLAIINQRLDRLRAASVPLYLEDARDYIRLSRTLGELQPQVLVHLAAVAHAGRSNKDPMSTFDHSLHTLENSLDYARGRVERLVYLSSSMVYGDFKQTEVTEEHPLDPIGIYGALKLAGERFVIAYRQVFDLPYTIIRPSALYGPGCVSRRVIQAFIEDGMAGRALRIEGDGSDRLDFSYVDDVVDGVCRAISSPAATDEAFNVTAGCARSLLDVATLVQHHFPGVDMDFVAPPRLRPSRGTLGIGKAHALLGYEPSTSLEEGVERYVAWYRELTEDSQLPVGEA